MADIESQHCRLCLVTPSGVAPDRFATLLDDALSGGDVASLLVLADLAALPGLAAASVPIAQRHGVAAILVGDTQLTGHLRADGVHIETGHADLTEAVRSLRPAKIVGAAGLRSRDDAMRAGELDPDYLFFGRLDGDNAPGIFGKALDLAAWWAELFEIPAIVMGGASLESVGEAREAGVEFVALRSAVWEYPAGPRAAVAEANRLLRVELVR